METMFEQATIPVQDEATFSVVRQGLEEAFVPARVEQFLRDVAGARLRVRQFEAVLARGFLGAAAQAAYGKLGDSDRGQIREQYLRRVEKVAPEVRQKFFRLYAGY
ncbi:MAG TPA: hypothetical protein VME18_12560 [Acidobacteriaceae bacterium]|nr:hypothetical protein [Acidobacteriaceae bacterium]